MKNSTKLSRIFLLSAAFFAFCAHAGYPEQDANNGSNGNASQEPGDCGEPKSCGTEGNPINVISGTKFQVERVYKSAGEMPLEFNWYYNSRHFQTGVCTSCNPGSGGTLGTDIIGQWTHSYNSHLLFDPSTLGTGSGVVEVRREDGQSIWFVEYESEDPNAWNPPIKKFKPQEPGSVGFFAALGYDPDSPNYYTGFEYTTPHGMIETYDQNGYLIKIQNKSGSSVALTRATVAIDAATSETTVTVSKNTGGSISFKYRHPVTDNDYESGCFRCASELIDSDNNQYSFTLNSNDMLETIGFPLANGETATKSFLYEIDDTTFTSGCSAFWYCETALTGIVDEENVRYATWDYKNEQDYYSATPSAATVGWAYKSYHGVGSEIDDHVEIMGYAGDSHPADDRIVVKQYAHKIHYDIDHWDSSNQQYGDDKIVTPRVQKREDLTLAPYYANDQRAGNIEKSGIYYEYYDAGTPHAQASISKIKKVVEENGVLKTYNRYFEYDTEGKRTVTKIRETYGADSEETLQRVTNLQWDLDIRKLLWKRVSLDGTANTATKEVHYDYYANGRIKSITETDLTNYSQPYSTYGRQRKWEYTYSYYDSEQTRPSLVQLDGPEPGQGDMISWQYDIDGNFTKAVNTYGHFVEYLNFNGRGQPQLIRDNHSETIITYTPRGQVLQIVRNGAQTHYDYYKNQLLKRVTFDDGTWVERQYTSARKLKEISNNLGEKISFTRTIDPTSGITTVVVEVKDALGQIVNIDTKKYDALGRLYQQMEGNEVVAEYNYALSRLIRMTEFGHPQYGSLVTEYEFDGLKRLAKAILPKKVLSDPDATVLYAYTVDGDLTSVTDPEGLKTDYQYDGFGLLMKRNSPNTGESEYSYSLLGNLLTRSEANGLKHSYTYDDLGRLLSKTDGNTGQIIESRTYDQVDTEHTFAMGRVSKVQDLSGETNYGYDINGNLTWVGKTIALPSGQVGVDLMYEYDSMGRITRVTYPSGQVVQNIFSNGRLISVESTQNGVTEVVANLFSHQAFGGITGYAFGNGVSLSTLFDTSGRLNELTVQGGAGVIQNLGYTYDNFGNIVLQNDLQDPSKSQTYNYDHLHRLTEATGSYGNIAYSYDQVGNRLTQTQNGHDVYYQYIANSQMLESVASSGMPYLNRQFNYDESGNTIKDQRNGDTYIYEYDANNRLSRVLKKQ